MPAEHDVLIAGAGPAASALAIELASEGYDVVLLEAARFPRDKACGDYVSPRGLARLDALGCGHRVHELAGTPIRRSRLYLNRDRLVSGTLPEVPGLPPHGYAIPRRELDHALFERAHRAGASAREGCRVLGFEQGARGITALCTRDGKPHRETARLLIGADGATSAVANAARLRMNDSRYTLASMRAYVHGLTLDHTIMYFDEEYFPGYGWIFPVRPGLCNIGVGMVSETLVNSGLRLPDFYARFQRFVRRLAEARGCAVEIGPHKGWPIRTYGGARKNYFERGLLIGEAGCFVDPINGEGIPLAFDSARVAARTVRAAFRRGRFGERDLAGYERDWRATFDPDLGISDLVVSMIRNRHLLPIWLAAFRTMSETAGRDPRYAAITGGILGGVVPARAALTPEMFARTLARVRLGSLEGSTWQSAIAGALRSDRVGIRSWVVEVEAKQRKVALRSLARLVGLSSS